MKAVMNMHLLFAIVFILTEVCWGQEITYEDGIIKVFRGESEAALGDGEEFCFSYPSNYFEVPETPQKYYRLKQQTNLNPCNASLPANVTSQGSLAFMKTYEGCNFTKYVDFIQAEKSSGLLLFITNPGLVSVKDLKSNYSLDVMALVGKNMGEQISKFVNSGDVPEPWIQFRKNVTPGREFEGSIVVLWLIAVVCVLLGSLINPFQDTSSSSQHILENESNDAVDDPNKPVQVHFNVIIVLVLVAFVSGTLLLLYFFYDYLVFFFIGVFCFASGRALYDILNQVANRCTRGTSLPRVKQCGIHQILIAVICIALPVTWFVLRRDANIWILQDLLGISFCIHLIQTLRIPNLKICTLLLSLLFIYDIFFVFITPFFTSDGKSVMVEVATGGGSEETLPLLVKIPHLRSPPSVCFDRSYSLLGFGDIIIPGFLACFSHAFDAIRGDRKKPYFITAMLGYGGGLALAFVVLFVTQAGQPALLYIVPCMLIPLYIVGGIKGQIPDLWKGTISITEVEP